MNENELITTYSVSHQNETNQQIHMVCVPVIFFSVVAVIYYYLPFVLTAALVTATLVFYYTKMRDYLLLMIVLYGVVLFICSVFASSPYFVLINIILFVVAWIGQFWGHKIEGRKPSFFQDLLFLLVGPAWIMQKMKEALMGSKD